MNILDTAHLAQRLRDQQIRFEAPERLQIERLQRLPSRKPPANPAVDFHAGRVRRDVRSRHLRLSPHSRRIIKFVRHSHELLFQPEAADDLRRTR